MRPFSGKISELPQKWRVFRTKTLLFGSLFPAHSASKNKMIEQGNLTRLKAIQTSPVARQAPSQETAREPQRKLAEKVMPVDIRELTAQPDQGFDAKVTQDVKKKVRVQYQVEEHDLDRIRSCLRKPKMSVPDIGKHTFFHFLKTECPE